MINEIVKLNNDTNYIHTKWTVVHAQIGSTLANSQVWIKCVSHGCDTEVNLTAFKLTSDGYKPVLEDGRQMKQDPYTGVDKSGIVGTIGEYRIVTLDQISAYSRGGKIDFTSNILIG